MSRLDPLLESARRESDAGPCDVVVAEFVFGGYRCGEAAMDTIEWDGQRWRVCEFHLAMGREPK